MRQLKWFVVLILSQVAIPAIAQRVPPASFGVALGASPTVQGRNLPHETGAHVAAFVEVPRALGRLSVRAEVSREIS